MKKHSRVASRRSFVAGVSAFHGTSHTEKTGMGKRGAGRWFARSMCALLMVALLAGIGPSAVAESGGAVSIDAVPEKEMYFYSAVLQDGKLLLVSDEGIYSYVPGEEDIRQMLTFDAETLEKLGLQRPLMLIGGQGAVYALQTDMEGARLTAVAIKEDGLQVPGKPIKLPWGEALKRVMPEEEGLNTPSRVVLMDDQMHMLFQTWTTKGSDQFILSYQLKDGAQPQVRDAKHVHHIAPYKDGQLLAVVMDETNSWDEVNKRQRAPEIMAYNLADDTMTSIGSAGQPFRYDENLLYEAETDTIYITGNAELLSKRGGANFEVCAYLDSSYGSRMMGGRLFLLEPGKVLVVGGQGVALRTTDPEQLPDVRLNIYGGYLDDAAKKAIRGLGNVAVRFVDGEYYPNAQAFGQALLAAEDQIDIFMMDGMYMDLTSLQKKGYCLDLSGSQALKDYVNQVYPELRAAGELDGKLMMLPVEAYAYMFGYHPKVFKAMNIEPPTTFFELCDLIERWNDDLADEHADFTPFRSSDIRGELSRIALMMYADAAQQRGEAFKYSDPLLKRMLERVDKLRIDNLGMNINSESATAEKETQELYNKVSMVEDYFDLGLQNLKYMIDSEKWPELLSSERSGVRMPLRLVADEGVPFNVSLRTRMIAVSAKSKHPELATKYLELYVQNLRPEQKAAMMPGLNDAIPNEDYDRYIGYMQEHIQTLEKAIAKAEGAEKTELEAQLKKYKESAEGEKERLKFLVSEEAVKLYREIMENRYVVGFDSMRVVMNTEDMQNVLTRFLQKQIPLEQFLQEADGKLRLMRLENQ